MTQITYREYYGKSLLIVEGHCGYGEKGSDIVCAGVSALVGTLVNCLLDEDVADRIRLVRNIVRDGYVCLEVEHFPFCLSRTKAIVETVVTGLYALSEEYPEHIRFE